MKQILLIAIVLFSVSCGRVEITSAPVAATWEPEFDIYMQNFKKYAALGGSDITNRMYNLKMKFASTSGVTTSYPGEVLGYCSHPAYSPTYDSPVDARYRDIIIDRGWWDKFLDLDKEELLFHELGHCVFNLPHNDTEMSIMWLNSFTLNVADSLMNKYQIGHNIYGWYRAHYLSQFFGVPESEFENFRNVVY